MKRSSISFGSYQRSTNQGSLFQGSTFKNNEMSNNNGMPVESEVSPGVNPFNNPYNSRSPMYSPLNFTQGGGLSPAYPHFRSSISMVSSPGVCEFEANRPLFAVDWSCDDYVCMGSYKEDNMNKLQIINTNDLLTWNKVAEYSITYPVSNIQWIPAQLQPRKFATCSDSLRIWSLQDETSSMDEILNLSYCKYNKLRQSSSQLDMNETRTSKGVDPAILGQFPPITSFHWNPINTNLLISSSIDTTCIVWDLQSTNYVKTQLIAHDSEVFDVRFLAQSTQLFASCGGDGSVRVFDLRSLAHSTIIYESTTNPSMPDISSSSGDNTTSLDAMPGSSADSISNPHALLRLEPSTNDPNVIATFGVDSNSVLILDMRNPGTPVLTLDAHSAPINQIKWHPTKKNTIISCSDDCQILYWDLNDTTNVSYTHMDPNITPENDNTSNFNVKTNGLKSMNTPAMYYSNKGKEVNNIVWRPRNGDWLGYISSKRFHNVKVFP